MKKLFHRRDAEAQRIRTSKLSLHPQSHFFPLLPPRPKVLMLVFPLRLGVSAVNSKFGVLVCA